MPLRLVLNESIKEIVFPSYIFKSLEVSLRLSDAGLPPELHSVPFNTTIVDDPSPNNLIHLLSRPRVVVENFVVSFNPQGLQHNCAQFHPNMLHRVELARDAVREDPMLPCHHLPRPLSVSPADQHSGCGWLSIKRSAQKYIPKICEAQILQTVSGRPNT